MVSKGWFAVIFAIPNLFRNISDAKTTDSNRGRQVQHD